MNNVLNANVSGAYVKKLREDSGLTYYDFAQLLSVSPQTIQNWELDKTKPSGLQLANLMGLRRKIDLHIAQNKSKDDLPVIIKNILIAGGVFAFLFWLFSNED